MDIDELIKILGIKNPTKKIKEHPKMLQLLEYTKSHDIYEHDFIIQEDAFITLLENINSLDVLLNILKKSYILLGINYHALEYAKFFNLYNPEILDYSLDANILFDEEYLKYASIEWTEEILKNQEKVLEINNKTLTLKDNGDEESVDYLESFLLNLIALKEAKNLGLLKDAIRKLSE